MAKNSSKKENKIDALQMKWNRKKGHIDQININEGHITQMFSGDISLKCYKWMNFELRLLICWLLFNASCQYSESIILSKWIKYQKYFKQKITMKICLTSSLCRYKIILIMWVISKAYFYEQVFSFNHKVLDYLSSTQIVSRIELFTSHYKSPKEMDIGIFLNRIF